MTVVTRFAPSPTGFLHIGGARTALFNWLFARHHGGKFLLRIEDTDRARSTQEAVDAIFEGMQWLGLDWDEEPVFQFGRADRHRAMAEKLLDEGLAYRCYCTPEELSTMREKQRKESKPVRYDGTWRDRDPADYPKDAPYSVRLKVPHEGETVIEDEVQGSVTIQNMQLDDMILLRSDGTPTYMLSVVVDDHDMGITHIIRGDDHLTNAFRQTHLYRALGWVPPSFSHISLIHGPDGAKMSKRHGALGAEAYRDMGFLPEAICNYLLKLGWGHGDDEIIPQDKAIEWFDLDGVGKSPARFDMTKLSSINAHYIRESDDARLLDAMMPFFEEGLDHDLTDAEKTILTDAMPGLKERAKNLIELADSARFYVAKRPLSMIPKAEKLINKADAKTHLAAFLSLIETNDFDKDVLENAARTYCEENEVKLGAVAQPLRAALTGSNVSPPIFDVLISLGKEESCARIKDVL